MRYFWQKNSMGMVLLLVLLTSAALLWAVPGDLDLTFGAGNGYVTTDVNDIDFGLSMVVDTTGRIIVAGQSIDTNNIGEPSIEYGVILRYLSDGTPDSTFGDAGKVVNEFENGEGVYFGIVLDDTEKLVVAGRKNGNGLVARFNQDGTPDLTFGTDGEVITGSDQLYEEFRAINITPDGKIVAAGCSMVDYEDSDNHILLARYNADGTPDESFGNQGVQISVAGCAELSLLVDESGGLTLAGFRGIRGKDTDILVAKYLANGALDPNFGDDGVVITDLDDRDEAYHVIRDEINRLVVAGYSSDVDTEFIMLNYVLVRYLPDGSLDSSFGSNGIVTGNIQDSSEIFGLTLDASGKIIIAGNTAQFTSADDFIIYGFVARHNFDGTLDTTFGNGAGFSLISYQGSGATYPVDVVVDNLGRILTTGTWGDTLDIVDYFVARYEGDPLPTAAPTITTTPVSSTETPTITATPEISITPSSTATESTPTTTNLVINGGFEANNGSIDGWQSKNLGKDKVKCNKPGKVIAYERNCAFRFKGGIGAKSQLVQKPDLAGLNFASGHIFTLQAYIHARGQVDFQLKAKFTYADDTKEKIVLNLAETTDAYTHFADDYALTDAGLVKIKVALKNRSTSGKIDVDKVSLSYAAAESMLLPFP